VLPSKRSVTRATIASPSAATFDIQQCGGEAVIPSTATSVCLTQPHRAIERRIHAASPTRSRASRPGNSLSPRRELPRRSSGRSHKAKSSSRCRHGGTFLFYALQHGTTPWPNAPIVSDCSRQGLERNGRTNFRRGRKIGETPEGVMHLDHDTADSGQIDT
jgi:hypothetical protein